MLMTMRAHSEGYRALSLWVARALDAERHSADPKIRQRAEDMTALMTPVVKALLTDLGHEAAQLGVQVYGGHGYIREHGVEQYARDLRIAMLYEGTNGVQALDLVGRKLPAHGGRYLKSFFHPVAEFIESQKVVPSMEKIVEALEKAFGALQLSAATIAEKGMADSEEAGAASSGLSPPALPRRDRPSFRQIGEDRGHEEDDGPRSRRLLRRQAGDGALLLRSVVAPGRKPVHRDQGRQGIHDGPARRGVLIDERSIAVMPAKAGMTGLPRSA